MDRQRIDKWLWHARVVRTRSAAAALVNEGFVRLNSLRVEAASRPVKCGDVLTIALGHVRVLKVAGFSERRGGAPQAQTLYEDLTPPKPPPAEQEPPVAMREPGSGRPTKQERRALDRLIGRDD